MFDLKNAEVELCTSDYILNRLSQEEIWYYYVPEFSLRKFIKSPLRNDDNNPSFSFKQLGDGTIIFRDWSKNEFKGDIFKFLMLKYNVNFNEAVKIIYNDLIKNSPTIKKPIIYNNSYKEIDKSKILIPNFQAYRGVDLLYWSKYGISIKTLFDYNVKSCKSVLVWSSRKEHYFPKYYSFENPMYCYKFIDIETNKTYYKIYRPNDNKFKWLFNGTANCVEGYDQLPWIDDILIITKSLKDIMCLKEMGYNSISLQGETNKLNENLYQLLSKRFKKIISLYDNDEAGINGMIYLKENYNIPMIILPFDTKDVSDTYVKHGKKEILNFLKENVK